MSLDLTTLRFLKSRERYARLARVIPQQALDTRTTTLIKDFGRYFREFQDAQVIEPSSFRILFSQLHPKLSDEDVAFYHSLFDDVVSEDVPAEVEAGLMQRLAAAATAYDLMKDIEAFNNGEEIDLRRATEQRIQDFDAFVKRKVKNPQVLTPIEDLIKKEEDDFGLHFRTPALNRHIKPLRPGDFMIWAARPDKGKTSTLLGEVTHMATQIDKLWPGENRCGLWLNNEGPGENIVMRAFQASIGITVDDMIALNQKPASTPENIERYRSALREQYAASLGGRAGAFRIFDIHGFWSHEVEELIARYNPAFVVFDMIDNIRFGGEVSNNGQRTDQLLEAMYQWARLMAVKYDFLAIATSQISADADGEPYPTLPQLKDSKTGKQGAADVIVTIGTVNDQQLEWSRYLGTTKNKRGRRGMANSPRCEVHFDKDRSRLVEYGTK